MLTFEIIVTEEEVVLSPEGEAILLSAAREALEAQALSGVNSQGQPMIGAKGQTLTLHGSSDQLWTNVTEAPAAGGLIFNEPYAEPVLIGHQADALNDAAQAALEEKLTPMLNEQVTNKEVP